MEKPYIAGAFFRQKLATMVERGEGRIVCFWGKGGETRGLGGEGLLQGGSTILKGVLKNGLELRHSLFKLSNKAVAF
jgi:hypothetical protein